MLDRICRAIFVTMVVLWVGVASPQESGLTDPESPPTPGDPAAAEQVARANLSEANDLVREGDYVRAEQVLSSLGEDFPEDPSLLLMHGEVLLALSQPARALPLLQKAVDVDGERPRVHFQLATAMLGTGDRAGALEAFAREIELNEDEQVRAMVHVNRKVLLEQGGNLVDAARELEALLDLDPEKVAAFGTPGSFCGEMASLYIEAGNLEEAARSLERGLELGFRSAKHWQSLGARHAQGEAWEAAIASFEKALEIDPELSDAERSLAAALDQSGRTEEAVAHLRRYLELAPDAPDAERVNQRIREIDGG